MGLEKIDKKTSEQFTWASFIEYYNNLIDHEILSFCKDKKHSYYGGKCTISSTINEDEFTRNTFLIVVSVLYYNEEGNADPSMITFVYRTGFKDRKDANHFKPERLNAAKKKNGSDSHTKEVCQSDDTSSNSSLSHSGLQSLIPDDSNILQSNTSPDARGDGMFIVQTFQSKESYQREGRYG